MQPRSKGALWSNDACSGAAQPAPAAPAKEKRGSKRPLPDADEGGRRPMRSIRSFPRPRGRVRPGLGL